MNEHEEAAQVRVIRSADKLAKWRTVYTGWLLGTRAHEDPESRYHRNRNELLLLMRAELSAVTRLISELPGVTREHILTVMAEEYEALDSSLEEFFPGYSSRPDGMSIKLPEAAETMRRFGFPP